MVAVKSIRLAKSLASVCMNWLLSALDGWHSKVNKLNTAASFGFSYQRTMMSRLNSESGDALASRYVNGGDIWRRCTLK